MIVSSVVGIFENVVAALPIVCLLYTSLNNDEDTKTTDDMEPKKPEEKTSPVKEILSWVLTIAFAIVAAILIKNYVIINANIPSGSMENTIQIGDDIFGFRLAYTFSDPKRGDIVIFNAPDSPSEKYIKRVIGPVSYTHLDVYKRQGESPPFFSQKIK